MSIGIDKEWKCHRRLKLKLSYQVRPRQAGRTWNEVRVEMLIIFLVPKIQKHGAECAELVLFPLDIPNPYRWFMSLVHSRQWSKSSPNFLKNEAEEVLNEIKFLWSASQKHGAECPESRFILLMLHGIHPIEDNEASKLLRSSMYQGGIVCIVASCKSPDDRMDVSCRE